MTRHVLYIEDDEAQAVLITHYIEQEDYGITVDFASTGKEGIAAFDPGRYDLVVIDYNLPDAQAPLIAEGIFAKCHPFPIVFVSSAFADNHLTTAETLGIKHCLEKDDIKEILLKIAALARTNQQQRCPLAPT